MHTYTQILDNLCLTMFISTLATPTDFPPIIDISQTPTINSGDRKVSRDNNRLGCCGVSTRLKLISITNVDLQTSR